MADDARLHELLDLVEQSRREGDKDTEAKAIAAYKAASAPPEQSAWGKVKTAVAALPKSAVGAYETGLHVGSQMVAAPVQGVASLWGMATGDSGHRMESARQNINAVGNAMTYQPQTNFGRSMSRTADSILALPAQGGDWVGDRVVDATGSAGAGAATTVALQSIPVLLGARSASAKAARVQPAGGSGSIGAAAQAAQDYVTNRVGMDWNSLSGDFQKKLTQVAQSAGNLDSLSPEAVARQARLEKLGIPATRGQVTRDLGQLTTEENLTRSSAGQGVRDINSAQDVRLHELVSALRDPNAPTTPGAVGDAVQGAARAFEKSSEGHYKALYEKAQNTEPNATVPVDSLEAFVRGNPEVLNPRIQHLAWLQSWLKKSKIGQTIESEGAPQVVYDNMGMPREVPGAVTQITKNREVRLAELQDLRVKANKIRAAGGNDAYYAGEVVKAIDSAMEGAPDGAQAWKDANAAFKAHKLKFEDQGGVNRLVDDASRTDRRVALEDTFDRTVRTGSNDQLRQVRDLLMAEKSPEGAAAWQALKSATVDYLREKAAGKRAIPGENGQLQFNSTFVDALHDLAADGKIETLFGKDGAAQLQAIADATRDVRTKPATRIAGSDTTSRALAMFEKFASTVGKIPLVGDTTVGAVKGVQKLRQMGEDTRAAKQAETLPVDEAAAQSEANALRRNRSNKATNALRMAAPGSASGATQNALRDRR